MAVLNNAMINHIIGHCLWVHRHVMPLPFTCLLLSNYLKVTIKFIPSVAHNLGGLSLSLQFQCFICFLNTSLFNRLNGLDGVPL